MIDTYCYRAPSRAADGRQREALCDWAQYHCAGARRPAGCRGNLGRWKCNRQRCGDEGTKVMMWWRWWWRWRWLSLCRWNHLAKHCQSIFKFGNSGSHICAGLSLACLAYYKCAKPVLDEQATAGIILDLPIIIDHHRLLLRHSKHAQKFPSIHATVKLVGPYTL